MIINWTCVFCLHKSINKDYIQLKETVEYGESTDLIEVQIEKKQLKETIHKTEQKLIHFKKRIYPILKKLLPNDYENVIEILIEGHL